MSLDAARDAARRQSGILSARQLAALGISRHRIGELVRRGALARIARGIYAIAEQALPDPARVAAVLGGVLSYESMLAWLNIDLPTPPTSVHVTVPRDRKRTKSALPGVQCYRAWIGEVWVVRGVRVLPPVRVAVDIARNRDLAYAVAVVDAMVRARLLRVESVLESLCRALLCRNGLLPARTQYNLVHPRTGWIGRLDFAWPALRIAVEADGYATHRDRYRRDRRRWTACNRAGWLLAVFTWEDVVYDPAYVIATVRDLIEERAESAAAAA